MQDTDPRTLYVELIKRCLIGSIYEDPTFLRSASGVQIADYNPEARRFGHDWPVKAHTMIGESRMNNLRDAVYHILGNQVPGDLIETGVWRGGSCIFMRAILAAFGVTDRTVWVADSFQGLPPPDAERYPADRGDDLHTVQELSISIEEVTENFKKYNLLDDQVKFLSGWFKDTLPTAPIERLALLRLDGDMYESTMDGLNALYEKLSPRGVVIVDDYGLGPCRKAVHDYREQHGVTAPLQLIDVQSQSVFWIKPETA